MSKTVRHRKHKAWSHPGQSRFENADQQEVSACLRKTGVFGHEKEALAFARKTGGPRGDDTKVWRAYHCPHCKKWHLTSKETK